MDAKITVVVPIYNAEEFLKKCIDSIVNQTMKEIEILLVDDGSTDSSPAICDEYAKNDPRVRVIHKQNGGVCDARNVAMKEIRTEYFTYMDSDDWFPENACERLYLTAKKYNADYVLGAYYCVLPSGIKVKSPYSDDLIVFDHDKIVKKIMNDTLGLTGDRLSTPSFIDSLLTCTSKMFKTEVVIKNNLQWTSRKETYSDCMDFLFRYAYYCENAVYFNEPLYYYRRTNTGSQTAAYRPRTIELWQVELDMVHNFIEEHKLDSLWDAYYSRICFTIIPIGGNAYRMGSKKDAMKEIHRMLDLPMYKEAFKHFSISALPIIYRPLFFFAKHKNYSLFYYMTVIMRKLMSRR